MGELFTFGNFFAGFILLSGFMALVGLIIGSYALLKVLSFERSTHTVQFQPVENDAWATPEKEIDELNKELKTIPRDSKEEVVF